MFVAALADKDSTADDARQGNGEGEGLIPEGIALAFRLMYSQGY